MDDTAVNTGNTGNADASKVDDTAVNTGNTGNESAADYDTETMNESTLRPRNSLLDKLYDWIEESSGPNLNVQEHDIPPFNAEHVLKRKPKGPSTKSVDEVELETPPGIRRAAASSGLELARRTEDETAVENFLKGLLEHYTEE